MDSVSAAANRAPQQPASSFLEGQMQECLTGMAGVTFGDADAPRARVLFRRRAGQDVRPETGERLSRASLNSSVDIMSIDTAAVAYGSLPVHLPLETLREHLSSHGLTPSVADVHEVHVGECSHFVFQRDGKGSYLINAKAENLEELLRDTALVSRALSAVPLEHTVEVYDPERRLVRLFAYPTAVSSDSEFAPAAVSHPVSDT